MPQFSAEEFWQFSVAHYERPGVKDACLSLQDSTDADVNLLLLAIWLKKGGVEIAADTVDNLLATSKHWRTEKIGPLRERRRKEPKASGNYRAFLADELAAEKGEQFALIKCLNQPDKGGQSFVDFWDGYSKTLHISAAQKKALIGSF